MKALSIRQPWAWLICHGYKDVENRTWFSNYKGPLLIHAGKTMTRADYEACEVFCISIADMTGLIPFPSFAQLQTRMGGIVGQVDMVECVSDSMSPWFVGDYGFVMRNQKVLPFRPLKGALGFFDVKEAA